MPFPRRLLTEGEEVVVELRPHWTYLGRSLPAAVAVLALLVSAVVAWPSAPAAIGVALLVLLGLTALWLGARVLRWRTTTLVITTARVARRAGVVARRGLDIRLERINEISYHQTILGRVIGVGELLLEVGGETGVVVFDHVRRPAAVAGVVHEQIEALHARRRSGRDDAGSGPWPPDDAHWSDDTPPAGMRAGRGRRRDEAGPSVAEQLIELDELRRRGILSDAEFAAKKAQLLDRL